jgi:hypothetical protein
MDAMLPPGRLYHVGYVVADLDEAMSQLGTVFRVEWAQRARRKMWVTRAGHDAEELEFWITYSTTGPPHIELIEGLPGSIWDPSDGPHLHHVGMWAVDDLERDAQRLVELGFPIAAHGNDEDGRLARFTYHSNPYGPWIELVMPATREPFERWMNGEPFITG